jgi:pimeloyl-ACP methyl ester carboxylesterase
LQHFTASDGARIAFEVNGEGRPLVLLHGLMAHSGFFRFQRPLASEFQLVEIDFRGHGASRSASERLDVEALASDVGDLVAQLDLEGAIGIGWSLGAAILWQVLAGRASSHFAGAVIVDMSPRVLNDGDWALGLSPEVVEARTSAIRDDYENFAVAAGQNIFAQPLDGTRELAAWAGEQFAQNSSAAMSAVWGSLLEKDFRELLPRIEQPTLIVHGARSQLYSPATARHLASALPRARAISFERSGHAPHMEQPELFNTIVRDFAASLPRVRQSQQTA